MKRVSCSNRYLLTGLLIVILAGIGIRLIISRLGVPFTWPDTKGYFGVAQMIQEGDFTGYYGARTPGYPLLILLVGQQPQLLVIVQRMLGLATSLLTFWLCYELTHSSLLATLAGVLLNLNAVQLVHELSLMTEALSAFGATLSLLLWLLALKRLEGGGRFFPLLLASGVTSAFSALVRPSLTFLPLLLSAFSLLKIWQVKRHFWHTSLGMLLPALVLLGGWSWFNYSRFGIFTLSSIGGHSIISITMGYVEAAPDEFAPVRDVLLAKRPEWIRTCDIPVGVKSVYITEVSKATGLNFAQVCQAYWKLSLAAIMRAPSCFLRIFLISWRNYWLSGIYPDWDRYLAPAPAFLAQAKALWQLLRPIYDSLTALVFLVFPALLIRLLAARGSGFQGRLFWWSAFSLLSLTAALVHTALVVGNYRYQLVTLPLNLCLALMALQLIWDGVRAWLRRWGEGQLAA